MNLSGCLSSDLSSRLQRQTPMRLHAPRFVAAAAASDSPRKWGAGWGKKSPLATAIPLPTPQPLDQSQPLNKSSPAQGQVTPSPVITPFPAMSNSQPIDIARVKQQTDLARTFEAAIVEHFKKVGYTNCCVAGTMLLHEELLARGIPSKPCEGVLVSQTRGSPSLFGIWHAWLECCGERFDIALGAQADNFRGMQVTHSCYTHAQLPMNVARIDLDTEDARLMASMLQNQWSQLAASGFDPALFWDHAPPEIQRLRADAKKAVAREEKKMQDKGSGA
eukprot:gene6979-2545_t